MHVSYWMHDVHYMVIFLPCSVPPPSGWPTFYSEQIFGPRHFGPDGHLPILPNPVLQDTCPLTCGGLWDTLHKGQGGAVSTIKVCVHLWMWAFMAGWIHEPAQSLDPRLSCTYVNALTQSQSQRIGILEDGSKTKVIKWRTLVVCSECAQHAK